MGWKKEDPFCGVQVDLDDDITDEQAEGIFAADADDAPRYHDQEAGR